jgi:hypothetical protein
MRPGLSTGAGVGEKAAAEAFELEGPLRVLDQRFIGRRLQHIERDHRG